MRRKRPDMQRGGWQTSPAGGHLCERQRGFSDYQMTLLAELRALEESEMCARALPASARANDQLLISLQSSSICT